MTAFTASYSAADVTLGPNTISVGDPNTYLVAGSSQDGRLRWNLHYQREGASWFAGDRINVQSLAWEQMSWLLYMPRAGVWGSLTVDGQTFTTLIVPDTTITTGDNGTSRPSSGIGRNIPNPI